MADDAPDLLPAHGSQRLPGSAARRTSTAVRLLRFLAGNLRRQPQRAPDGSWTWPTVALRPAVDAPDQPSA